MSASPIRVLVVEDSAKFRYSTVNFLKKESCIKVVGEAADGIEALAKILHLGIDVIILDIEMPRKNGLELLEDIKDRQNTPPVIVFSAFVTRKSKLLESIKKLGIFNYLIKAEGNSIESLELAGLELLQQIFAAGNTYHRSNNLAPCCKRSEHNIVPRLNASSKHGYPNNVKHLEHAVFDILYDEKLLPLPKIRPQLIAIGISTGGPRILKDVFADLPARFPVPIVVVQHMSPGFTSALTHNLDTYSKLRVKEALNNELLKAATVYIAPNAVHTRIINSSAGLRIRLETGSTISGHRPSIDCLFGSIAEAKLAAATIAVLMTGMGQDGASKIGDIYKGGGITLAQDEKSSIVYGMPKVAYSNGFIHRQFNNKSLSAILRHLVSF